ncbi:MAG: TrkA family potassium uptake protein [Planctomycetes bacterium]|nr:TrkA family potassium uptake protein [Planctomycetota bacterium]
MIGECVVIGLGRFGWAVATNLARHGQSVLAVDTDPAKVQAISAEVEAAVTCDTTDEAAIAELHLERATCVVVAIGVEHKDASILTTALLRQAGVPRIIARAVNDLHGRVLVAVGAHEIVNPEKEMGQRIARRLARPSLIEQIPLGDGADLAELQAPEAFVGRTLVELDVRRRWDVSVVAIRRGGKVQSYVLGMGPLEPGDVLVVIGAPDALGRLAALA